MTSESHTHFDFILFHITTITFKIINTILFCFKINLEHFVYKRQPLPLKFINTILFCFKINLEHFVYKSPLHRILHIIKNHANITALL